MVDVDSYIKKLEPRGQRSGLKKFETEILKLRANDLSLQQIVDFLAENGVTTTMGNLSRFIKKAMSGDAPGSTPKRRESDLPVEPIEQKTGEENPAAPDGVKGSDEKDGETKAPEQLAGAVAPARGVRKTKPKEQTAREKIAADMAKYDAEQAANAISVKK